MPRIERQTTLDYVNKANEAMLRLHYQSRNDATKHTSELENIHDPEMAPLQAYMMSAQPWRNIQVEMNYTQSFINIIRSIKTLSIPILENLHCEVCEAMDDNSRRWAVPGKLRQGDAFMATSNGQVKTIYAPADMVSDLLARGVVNPFNTCLMEDRDIIITAAILHQNVTMIHPFADGNGRVARILAEATLLRGFSGITQINLQEKLLRSRSEYCNLQAGVVSDGNWDEWISFFARCTKEAADSFIARP